MWCADPDPPRAPPPYRDGDGDGDGTGGGVSVQPSSVLKFTIINLRTQSFWRCGSIALPPEESTLQPGPIVAAFCADVMCGRATSFDAGTGAATAAAAEAACAAVFGGPSGEAPTPTLAAAAPPSTRSFFAGGS